MGQVLAGRSSTPEIDAMPPSPTAMFQYLAVTAGLDPVVQDRDRATISVRRVGLGHDGPNDEAK
jgi:hypothetical protein